MFARCKPKFPASFPDPGGSASYPNFPPRSRQATVAEERIIKPLTVDTRCTRSIKATLPLTATTVHSSSTMWKLSLFILYATALFALASADLHFPLNTCILTVRSTVGKVVDPHSLVTYGMPVPSIVSRKERLTWGFTGILNRFATSDPPVNRLTVRIQ